MRAFVNGLWLFVLAIGGGGPGSHAAAITPLASSSPPESPIQPDSAHPSLEYTVSGHLLYEILGLHPGKKQEYEFVMTVSNRIWAVEMRPQGALTVESSPMKKTWSNSKVVVQSAHFDHSLNDQDGQAEVELSDIPIFCESTFAQHVWLAYASQNYLNSATNGHIKPMGFLDRIVAHDFTTPAKWERLEADGLPASIRYDFDGIRWFKGNKLPLPDGWSNNPVDGPRLWATYETQGQGRTNVSKTIFPATFTLTAYDPLYEFHHGKRLAVYRTSGTTDSVTTKSDASLLDPKFTGRVSVVDWRRTDTEVTYSIQNSIIPGLAD